MPIRVQQKRTKTYYGLLTRITSPSFRFMPYKDPAKKREYLREYKKKHQVEISVRRSELFAETQRNKGILPQSWALCGHEYGICSSCGAGVKCKPFDGCIEPRHAHSYSMRTEKDKKYRNKRQQEAKDGIRPYQKSSDEGLARRSDRGKIIHQNKRLALNERFGGCCQRCGYDDFRVLELHHKNGDGSKHRRELGWRYSKYILHTPIEELKTIFELLCANCHGIITYEERKARPHTKKAKQGLVNEVSCS